MVGRHWKSTFLLGRPIFRGLVLRSVIRNSKPSNEKIAIEMWTSLFWFSKLDFFCAKFTLVHIAIFFDVLTFMLPSLCSKWSLKKTPKAWSDVVGACHTSLLLEIITCSGWKRCFSRHSSAKIKWSRKAGHLLAIATLTGEWVGLANFRRFFWHSCKVWMWNCGMESYWPRHKEWCASCGSSPLPGF